MLRRRKVRANEVDPGIIEELFEDPEMTDQLVAVEENTDLAAALTSLPERYREAVLLRYSDEYSFEEIAQIMGITEANARKIVQRACKKLRVTMRVSEAERKENQDK
jgi:RNA polymerase sigma factor (sigma-70 family)